MYYIDYALKTLIILFIFIVIIKIFMKVANYIGKELGIGEFLISLWSKMRKK